MTIQLAFIIGIITTLTIVGLMYGNFQNFWFGIKRKWHQTLEIRKFKKQSLIVYPKDLTTDEEIKLYLKKNYRNLPSEKEWEPLLINMIREMSNAGWNTDIPIYTKYKWSHYQMDVNTDNVELRRQLNEIIFKYLEICDTMDSDNNK